MKSDLKTLDELSRREFVASAAKACLGVGLLPLAGSYVHTPVNALEPGTRPAAARHVIYLNMSGAMSHLDTFGTNPDAPEIQGPTKSIPTSADGVIISENLPLTAKHMHNSAIIKTMMTSQGAHAQASYLMHTSYQMRGTIAHPTFGSWVAKMSGNINNTIPSNVQISGSPGGAGFLESKYGPLPIGNPGAGLANSLKADYIDQTRFDGRLALAQKMNTAYLDQYDQKQVRAYSDLYKDAINLMTSEDLNAFDISKEPESMNEMYGTSNFGQGCLLARRLVENGVRYVEVSRGGWDTHDNNFEAVANNCTDIDKALSALLTDLERRGLLNETMVVLTSEFGRTPRINARDGRDHWPYGFTAFLAGAGVKGGTMYGKMDKVGRNPEEGKFVDPAGLNATIGYAMGLPLNDVQYSPSGRPFKVAHDGEPLMDVLA
jgi:hypothetical protein